MRSLTRPPPILRVCECIRCYDREKAINVGSWTQTFSHSLTQTDAASMLESAAMGTFFTNGLSGNPYLSAHSVDSASNQHPLLNAIVLTTAENWSITTAEAQNTSVCEVRKWLHALQPSPGAVSSTTAAWHYASCTTYRRSECMVCFCNWLESESNTDGVVSKFRVGNYHAWR